MAACAAEPPPPQRPGAETLAAVQPFAEVNHRRLTEVCQGLETLDVWSSHTHIRGRPSENAKAVQGGQEQFIVAWRTPRQVRVDHVVREPAPAEQHPGEGVA